MPELPEVQTVVATLQPRLPGRTILGVRLSRPDIVRPAGFDLPPRLLGRRVVDISRRGKKIVVSLDTAERFYIHLGMTGRLTIEATDAPVRPHTHLSLDLPDGQLRFCDPRRFGGVWWLGSDDRHDANMGPEPLSMRPRQLALRLTRTRRAIKNALLDQTVVAGLGNIYVDESLFRAGIHPLTPANMLTPDQILALNRAIKTTLRRALRHRGSTLRDYRDANGEAGGFQKLHRVYGRTGEPCSICRTAIERVVLGGRSTHFCPRCQRGS